MDCKNKIRKKKQKKTADKILENGDMGLISNNCIRNFCKNYVSSAFKLFLGTFYVSLHLAIIVSGIIIIIFTKNIYYLLILLNVCIIDGICLTVFHECPLTILEKRCLNTNMSLINKRILNNLKINYKCNHVYETQCDLIINVGSICIIKLLILILFEVFKINVIIN